MLSFFVKGLAIGFSIAAPVGPIGVLCLQRTLAHGRVYGLCTGLGAATADAVYGALAALGLTIVADILVSGGDIFRLGGGVFLIALGLRAFRTRPAAVGGAEASGGPTPSLGKAFASTFLLTLANPMTIASFAAVFAGLGLGVEDGRTGPEGGLLVAGVFAGSALWWLALSGAAGLFRDRFADRLGFLNILSGIVLVGFGAAALASLA